MDEPVAGQSGGLGEGARFLEEMTGARHHRQLADAGERRAGPPVQGEHVGVGAADDEQRRGGDLMQPMAGEIGAIARPKTVYLTPDLPKTRSGKIMRRLLRDIATGHNLGDTTTLADASVVEEIRRRAAAAPLEE